MAQSVMIPVMMQTATEGGSLIRRRPNSETKTSGDTRAVLTNIPDLVKSNAQRRRLGKELTLSFGQKISILRNIIVTDSILNILEDNEAHSNCGDVAVLVDLSKYTKK